MPRDLPSGTVTFLFTDVEGSTRLLHELGAEGYAEALAEHRRILREAFTSRGGVEVDTQGDAFFVAFPTASGALAAAADATDTLAGGPIRVRVGIHTGTPHLTDEGYVGEDVHRAARIAAAGHGGQVLVSAATATLTGPGGLRDLGEHRLKDLSAPERIFQLGDGDFPPLKSLHQTNLPVPATPFLGREREVAEVAGQLAGGVRLLTLTGPGGTGKTRLALRSAGEASPGFPDGVWWVPLAPIRDPRLVLTETARAVGSRNGLVDHIADKRLLVVLDNFEQVVEAATDLAGLIAACPRLAVLVTSRETLRISGEHEYPVPPLDPAESVELFTARALAVRPDFVPDEAVAAICRRLDDLPLAVELAAARTRALTTTQILDRLDRRLALLTSGGRDLPERQRTLHGAIAWSHELLDPDEQRLFARLAVFRGGATLDAVEAVAEADLDTLESLVDKSLLRRRDDRFRMLETIREFAADRLAESGEAAGTERRHAEYFLALAEDAVPHLRTDSAEHLDRLDAEHDNIRAALDRLQAVGETQLVLRLAAAASRFWYLRSHFREGEQRLTAALAADQTPTAARAAALNGAAVMALNRGEATVARERAQAALAVSDSVGDAWEVAYATMMIANAQSQVNDPVAVATYERAVRAFNDLGDQHMVLITLSNLANMIGELGDPGRERELTQECLRLARELGNERMEASSLANLAMWHCFFGTDDDRVEQAEAMMVQALRIERRRGNLYESSIDLGGMAHVRALQGRLREAAVLLAASAAVLERIGGRADWTERRNQLTREAIAAGLNDGEAEAARSEGRSLSADEAIEHALNGE